MKHKGLRRTKQQEVLIKKRKSIDEVANAFFKSTFYNKSNNPIVDFYFVPYELVRTEDLITMMQDLTIFRRCMHDLKYPSHAQIERMSYLELITNYTNTTITNEEFERISSLIRNKLFVEQEKDFHKKLKEVLATREHVPNKAERKIVRKLKAQGKYIID